MSPWVGLYRPDKIFRVVDLPAPLPPSMPLTSPACTSNVMLSTAVKSLNFMVRFCTSTTGSMGSTIGIVLMDGCFTDRVGMFYFTWKTALVASTLGAAVMLSGIALTASEQRLPQPSVFQSTFHPADSKGILSKCNGAFTFTPEQEWFGVISQEYFDEHNVDGNLSFPVPPMVVPAYGYMSPESVNFENVDPKTGMDELQVNRYLWDGGMIIWLDQSFPEEGKAEVERFADGWNDENSRQVVVQEWTAEEPLPAERLIGFSAWGATQTCSIFDPLVFEDFAAVADQVHTVGLEAPDATLTEDGRLHPIDVQ